MKSSARSCPIPLCALLCALCALCALACHSENAFVRADGSTMGDAGSTAADGAAGDAAPDALPDLPHSDAAAADLAPSATTFYVSSSTGDDSNDGLSWATAWRTMAKVNSRTFLPGEAVRFQGTITDDFVKDPSSGTNGTPILFVGDGPFDGRARIKGIRLRQAEHVIFRNFEASGGGASASSAQLISTERQGRSAVRSVRFENLYLRDGRQGVYVGGSKHTDLTFVNTVIAGMWEDGVLLDDPAGDRFSYIGGAIKDTGRRGSGSWDVHGVYASGGHGHLFDGVEFSENHNGQSLSIRRGNITVRNCVFHGASDSSKFGILANWNEDEGSVNPYTGSPSKNLSYRIYRNVFIGPGYVVQGDNNDQGVDDPGNTWLVFNNTFININISFAWLQAQYYNVYLRNNVFSGGYVEVKAPVSGRVHELSHNGWWNAGTPQGSANLTGDPALNAAYEVTAAAYRDVGTPSISSSLSLVPSATDPLGYAGAAPDIGRTER